MNPNCNRLSPKRKSQHGGFSYNERLIVTDYRLNANHNLSSSIQLLTVIVTDYRLNANHNLSSSIQLLTVIVTDYRLNANHNMVNV